MSKFQMHTEDVSGNDMAAKLIAGLHVMSDALQVCRTSKLAKDYCGPISDAINELGWELADVVGHTDQSGFANHYRSGRLGVGLVVSRKHTSLRECQNELQVSFIEFSDKE